MCVHPHAHRLFCTFSFFFLNMIKQVSLFLSFFFFFIFKLYNIVLVLPNIEMNPPQVYMCSPSWTLFPPPSPFLWVIPVHQPQVSSIVHRTWTGDSFHIWYYRHFNAILPNHPTLSLSHRVQKTVLYISVSFKVCFISQFSSVAQSCPTLCDLKDCSMPGFPVLHYLPEFAQIHVHWVGNAIQPSHPLFHCIEVKLIFQ